MNFKYLQNMYVPMVLTQDTSQQHVAGINSQCTHMICTTKSLLPGEVPAPLGPCCAYPCMYISVFVRAACCCEMLILEFDRVSVPLLYAFSSICYIIHLL